MFACCMIRMIPYYFIPCTVNFSRVDASTGFQKFYLTVLYILLFFLLIVVIDHVSSGRRWRLCIYSIVFIGIFPGSSIDIAGQLG